MTPDSRNAEMVMPTICMRVVYEDLPDLIEIETRATSKDWSGVAKAYASPDVLLEQASTLEVWCERPNNICAIELGENFGMGFTALHFYPIDMAGHLRCHARLVTGGLSAEARAAEAWRLSVEWATEPGLVESFARDLQRLVKSGDGQAVLRCLLD